MTGYVKLFQSILGSSIWAGPDAELRVWIAILALKDRTHVVRISPPGLATIARVSLEQCRAALEKFRSPDMDSTSKDYDGRKIEELPEGGFLVLNGAKYARMLSLEERREYQRIKQAEYRQRDNELKAEKKPVKRGRPLKGERQYLKAVERGDEVEADRIAASGSKGVDELVREAVVSESASAEAETSGPTTGPGRDRLAPGHPGSDRTPESSPPVEEEAEGQLACPEVSPGGVAGGGQVERELADNGSGSDTEEISLEVPVEE